MIKKISELETANTEISDLKNIIASAEALIGKEGESGISKQIADQKAALEKRECTP
ncbi:hypothetical protein [[Acholeplasma] multilocale]|uniref:hypothetical protein n=1 Tax=[Acholeplasma] multilocale TaxID=264638 RepID=UPI000413923E|nr:hypothetical protein [[Acholeplasma] multilocale]